MASVFIASTKREVLNHFISFSRDQLDYIVRMWLNHYHERVPHRDVGRNYILGLLGETGLFKYLSP